MRSVSLLSASRWNMPWSLLHSAPPSEAGGSSPLVSHLQTVQLVCPDERAVNPSPLLLFVFFYWWEKLVPPGDRMVMDDDWLAGSGSAVYFHISSDSLSLP